VIIDDWSESPNSDSTFSTSGAAPSTHTRASLGSTFIISAIVAGVLTGVFVLWIVLNIDGARVTDAVDDLGELVAALLAAGACALAARRPSPARASWTLIGASSLAWAAGEAVWCYFDLLRDVPVPFPSLADAGFLLSVPLAIAGLLLFPSSFHRTAVRLQGLFDGLIIAGSLLFASWATVLGPLYRSHEGGAFKQALSLAYPVSDVILLSLVIILIARAGQYHRLSLGLVMAGIVAFAIADSSFSYLTEVNNYGNGTVLDSGWVVGYLLIGLGALWSTLSPSDEVRPTRESTVSLVAPYFPVLVVLAVTSVVLMTHHRIETVSWIMALALVVLTLGREVLRLVESLLQRTQTTEDAAVRGGASPSSDDDHEPALVGR
jgi:hypothetical protein